MAVLFLFCFFFFLSFFCSLQESQLPPALTQKRLRDRLRGVVFLLRNRGGVKIIPTDALCVSVFIRTKMICKANERESNKDNNFLFPFL